MTQPPDLASAGPPPPNDASPSRGPRRTVWAVLFVVVAVAAGGYFFVRQLRPDVEPPAAAAPPPAPVDSAAPLDSIIRPADLPGFDTEHLTDKQRLWLYHQAHLEQCSCGCGMNIAQCRVEDLTCPESPGRARELVAEAEQREP